MTGDDVELWIFRLENGNGNACAFVFPDRSVGVVDWGSRDPAQVVAFLDEVEPSRLRFVAATHSHADHTFGLVDFMEICRQRGIPIDGFFYPAIGRLTLDQWDYLGRAAIFAMQNNITCFPLSVRDFPEDFVERPPFLAKEDAWDVRVLAPPASKNHVHQIKSHLTDSRPGNATSLVLLFRYRDSDAIPGRALLTGDAMKSVLQFAAGHAAKHSEFHIDNDVLFVPHHGSRHNWPAWFTAHVHGIAAISASSAGRAHPSKEVLALLANVCGRSGGSTLFCTSYARVCREDFGPQPSDANDPLFGEGPCFGDLRIRLSRNGSTVLRHDSNGSLRRACGYCTHAAGATSA